MATAARFDSFHSSFDTSLPTAALSRHMHLVWIVLTGIAGLAALVMAFYTFQSIDPMLAGLMDDLRSIPGARNANGFFSLDAVN